jgi:hypothetical protein
MRHFTRLALAVGLVLPAAHQLTAQQDHTLGLNFRASSTSQLGVTWAMGGGFALRPSVSVSWDKSRTRYDPYLGYVDRTTTQVGLDLDLLFTLAAASRVATYLGTGGSVGERWLDGTGAFSWGAGTFFGVRLAVFDRLALFGELGVEYAHTGGDLGGNRVFVNTAPFAVLIYLH